MLDELSFAIKHFVPTLPEEVTVQAKAKLAELSSNSEANEEVIKNAFHDIGLQEYPHRKAYDELTHTSAEKKMKDMVIEHVDEVVRAVIKPHLESGVSLKELVNSEIFQGQLDPKQRYQVEDGILVATDKLAESLKGEVGDHGNEYQKLLDKWTKHVEDIHAQIDKLGALVPGGTEEQGLEISNKVRSFREGFLLTERDPELEEVKKEVEYWTDTFAEEEE
tara:strand:+ start:520 stop:1182 length:663 start_codon:yes stop_codon:yes gene_type:complete